MVKLNFGLATLLVRLWLRHAPRPETSWKFFLGYKFVASREIAPELVKSGVTEVYDVSLDDLARLHEWVFVSRHFCSRFRPSRVSKHKNRLGKRVSGTF